MEPIISVIILDFADDTYLIRCLNSIKRQTYGKSEFFLINSECSENIKNTYKIKSVFGNTRQEGVNKALKLSQGKYVFFTSTTAVIAPNVFETLKDEESKCEKAVYATFRIPKGDEFVEQYSSSLSIYGRLFEKEILNKNNINFENTLFSEEYFVAKYLKFFSKVSNVRTAEIYETNMELLGQIFSFGTDIKQFEELLEVLVDTPVGTGKDFLNKFIEQLYGEIGGDLKVLMPYILRISESLNREKELNYQLAGKYTRKYYEHLLNSKESECYEILKNYLKEFEVDEEYLKVILDAMNISVQQYEIMKCHDFDDYLFYKEKVPNNISISRYDMEIHEIKNTLKAEQEKLGKLEQILQKKADGELTEIFRTNENSVVSELQGPELAEFVIESYGKGNLGFKTILKSMKAWLKYKV